MARVARPGPFGLPIAEPPAREAFFLTGIAGSRLLSQLNTTLQAFTVVSHIRQTGTTVTNPFLWAKYQTNPNTTNDFPYSLILANGTTLTSRISIGNDFAFDNSVAADSVITLLKWNFVAASWDGQNNTICLNGTFKTNNVGALTLSTTAFYWCAGNSSSDNTAGGANTAMFNGIMWRPRLYNVVKSPGQILAMMGGFDDRRGLIEDFLNAEFPPNMRYRRGG